jgi:hypothetical protein
VLNLTAVKHDIGRLTCEVNSPIMLKSRRVKSHVGHGKERGEMPRCLDGLFHADVQVAVANF